MQSLNKGWTGRRLPILFLLVISVLLLSACSAGGPAQPTAPSPPAAATPSTAAETPADTAPAVSATSTAPAAAAGESPAAVETEPAAILRLAVIGDYGLAGEPLAQVAELVKSWQPDYILTTGDNNYPSGEAATIDQNIGQYFHEYIGNYQGGYGPGAQENRFYPSLGNHDIDSAMGEPYINYFTLPGNERYYDVQLGPVHVFVLNTDSREPDGVGRSSTQAAWLQAGLADSNAPWKLVIGHHPPYSSGVHGPVDWMDWPFAEWGATALLSGHDHIYERLSVDGIPYFINGLGGGPRYNFAQVLPESAVRYRENYGAMLIEADAARMVFRFINVAGEEIDRFSLGMPQASAEETATSPATPTQPELPQTASSLPAPQAYAWQPLVQGLSSPVGLLPAVDGSGRLYVLEQEGVIRVVADGELLPEPFLDLRDRVGRNANEQGLLGMAFHPDFNENGYFYLNYTDTDGNTVIARYQASEPASGAPLAQRDSELRLLYVLQPYSNHNGGHILFGPDGYLYIGMGDGGSGGDPQGNAQSTQTLLGKLLRLDVDGGQPYAIPPGNPYAQGEGGLPEIMALGLRNPWKFDFDAATGDLYIADVGQNTWEEINYLPAGEIAGANLGWDYREGPAAFEGQPPPDLTLVDPVAWYDRSQGCSITGGEVYRGQLFPDFAGVYLYADYCSGRVWGLLGQADGEFQNAQMFEISGRPVDFAQDPAGEFYLLDQSGVILQLVRR